MALVLRLEALCSDGSKKQIFNRVSLEHVLPQNPEAGSEWFTWFPDEDEREFWTHRLANLVPLHIRKNPEASNFEFDKKKKVYFKGKEGNETPFVLTQNVRSKPVWNPAVLAEQQERLVDKLKKHWLLEASI